jgi:hypothetical protein
MPSAVRLAIVALLVAPLAGCSALMEPVVGSGVSATAGRAVGDVKEVSLTGIGELMILQGEKPGLMVTADDNVLPLLETDSDDDKLKIRIKSGFAVTTKTPITYTLTVRRLEKLSLSGAGTAIADRLAGGTFTLKVSGSGGVTIRDLSVEKLAADLSGSGTATVAGTADKFTASVSGSGGIDASLLKARTADVTVSGSGSVAAWPADALKARVSGSGSVRYKGSPKVDQKTSGSGRVKPASVISSVVLPTCGTRPPRSRPRPPRRAAGRAARPRTIRSRTTRSPPPTRAAE